ncbi:MAG: hypothetical protein JWM56_1146 [Candidatus Peribacteria bacterium]|nr:hypothetical protein [Candidatus Peribacteria bacterium]
MVSIFSFTRKSKLQPLLLSFVIAALATPLLALKYSQAAEPQTLTLEASLKNLQAQWNQPIEGADKKRELHMRAVRIRSLLCLQGKSTYCTEYIARAKKVPNEKKPVASHVNIQKLAHAVAVAETSDCTTGTGRSHLNNCFGIRGKNGFVKFASKEESYAYFEEMWLRKYCDCFPTLAHARRYSAEEGTSWLHRVTVVYNRN